MHDSRDFIFGATVFVKTTILESIVEKHFDSYTVHHYFKEIIKKNDEIENTVNERTNWERDLLSEDLNDKTTEFGYNSYSQKNTNSYWEETNDEQEKSKIQNDLPQIESMVNNSRYEISKRVFGT